MGDTNSMAKALRALCLVAALLLLSGCAPERTGRVTILFGANLLGRIEADESPVQPRGGLAVQAAQVAGIRAESDGPTLLLDGGNLSDPAAGEAGLVDGVFLADELQRMGFDAFCLGPVETGLADDALAAQLGEGRRWLGGWRDAGRALGAKDTLLLRAGALRIGLAHWADRQWLPVGKAREQAVDLPLDMLKHLRGRCDLLVLVARTSPRGPEELARQVDGLVDLLLVAGARKAWSAPRRTGSVTILATGDHGRWLSRADVSVERGRVLSVEGSAVALDSRGPEDAGVRERVLRHAGEQVRARAERQESFRLEQLDRLGLERADFDGGDVYAGAGACASCHESIWQAWRGGEHARVYVRRLAAGDVPGIGAERRITTGWLRPGGWLGATETPELAGVQCEACHGPSEKHVASDGATETPGDAVASCAACHDGRAFTSAERWAASHPPSPHP